MIVRDRLTMIAWEAAAVAGQTVYTPKEVAETAKVTLLTVYRHLASGLLKGKKVGRQWRVTEDSLRDYLGI